MDFFDAYILAYGLCYLLSTTKKDFYLIRPRFPVFLTKALLLASGTLHIISALSNVPFIIFPLALAEAFSCVAHYTGMIEWNGLKDLRITNAAYISMAVADILDATFLLSKLAL